MKLITKDSLLTPVVLWSFFHFFIQGSGLSFCPHNFYIWRSDLGSTSTAITMSADDQFWAAAEPICMQRASFERHGRGYEAKHCKIWMWNEEIMLSRWKNALLNKHMRVCPHGLSTMTSHNVCYLLKCIFYLLLTDYSKWRLGLGLDLSRSDLRDYRLKSAKCIY